MKGNNLTVYTLPLAESNIAHFVNVIPAGLISQQIVYNYWSLAKYIQIDIECSSNTV